VNVTLGITVEIKVSEKREYVPVFVTCQKDTTDFHLAALFKNPDSYLDYRYFVPVICAIIQFGVLCMTLAFMVVMIWIKRAIFLRFHYYLGATLIITLLSIACQVWSVLRRMRDPKDSPVFIVEYSFNVLSDMMVFTSIVLCASGWGVHCVRKPIFSFVITAIFGLLYHLIDFLPIPARQGSSQWYLLEYLINLVSLCVISKSMVNELRGCERYLVSYALVTAAFGFDSTTTPVDRRIIMQYVLLCSGSIFLFLHLCLIHSTLYFDLSRILSESVGKSINSVFLVVLVLNYLPFKIKKEDWMQCFNEEYYPQCREEKLTYEARPPLRKGRKWESGMTLPMPPVLAKEEFGGWDGTEVDEYEVGLVELTDLLEHV
jgi:hypothetical protein